MEGEILTRRPDARKAEIKKVLREEHRLFTRLSWCASSNSSKLDRTVDHYLKSKAVHLVAAWHVSGQASGWNSWISIKSVSRDLSVYEPCSEPAQANLQPKANDGFRVTYNFGFENRVRQRIVKRCLEAIYNPQPFIFGVKGRGAASITDVVRQAYFDGYKWAVVGDIRNCFPSFNSSSLAECLPLPRRGCCQTNANSSLLVDENAGLGSEKLPPFSKRCVALGFERLAVVDVAVEIEMVVERCVG